MVMNIIRINHKHIPPVFNKTVACIGYFDGFHKGHQQLVKQAIEIAQKKNIDVSIITFDPDPWHIFKPEMKLYHLMSLSDKIQVSKSLGAQNFYILTFTKDFASLSADQFHDVLHQMNIDTLVCGFDFQYGCKNAGNVETLKKQNLFDVVVVDSINEDNKKISSSRIEPMILEGNVYDANHMTGYIYSIHGKIVHGFKRGSTLLNIPTANLLVDEEYVIPNTGVYAGCVSVDDTMYYAMINIGKNPTFENEIQTIEAHILNFDQDLYEKEVRFYFYKKIRDEKKFKNIDELKDQLVSDIKTTQNIMTSSNEVVKNTAKTWDKKLFM